MTSVKDVIVIKTSGTHSDIRALIHGELPTLSLTFRVVIILTSEIRTKLLEDNFEQTPVSPLCCPLTLLIDPVDPRSQRTNESISFPPHDCTHRPQGLGLCSVRWAANCLSDLSQGKTILDRLPTLHNRIAYPLAGKTA